MSHYNADLIDADKGIFKVFDVVLLRIESPYSMQCSDFDTEDTRGITFRFFDDCNEEIIEIASITVADVTSDKTEPDIANLTQEDVSKFDIQLFNACSDGLPTQGMTLNKWMGSHLNESKEKKELITAYTVYENGVENQFIAIRINANSKKIAAVGTFIIKRAEELANPIFSILKNMQIIPEPYENMSAIRQVIHRDFGIDIPLESGQGSLAEPYKLSFLDRHLYEFSRLQLINCVSTGRGLCWKTQSKEIITHESRTLEKFTIETIELTEIQKFEGTMTYYFESMEPSRSTQPNCILMMDTPRQGLLLPFEIGWLHFRYFTNFEEKAPGLGFSAAYSAPKIGATLYVYDKGLKHISDDLNDPLVQEEFEEVNAHIMERLPEAQVTLGKPKNQSLVRTYKVDPEGLKLSCIALTTSNNYFIKIRISWTRDYDFDAIAMNFLDEALHLFKVTRH